MQLTELRQNVRDLLGVRTTDAQVSVTRLDGWINLALRTIGAEQDWPWLDATDTFTTDGSSSYDLPADWRDTRSITVDGIDAHLVTVRTGDAFDVDFDDRAGQWSYSIDQGEATITFHPTPASDSTVIHRYVTDEPPLVEDDQEPLLPDRWATALVFKTAAHAARTTDDPAGAATYETDYQTSRRQMLNAVSRAHGPRRVRIRPGGFL